MSDVLVLATGGLEPDHTDGVEHRRYPRVDYLELQRLLPIDVLDYRVYNTPVLGAFSRHVETQLRSDLYLAGLGLLAQKSHRLVLTMSERVGIPFAGLHRWLPQPRPLATIFTCWSARQESVVTKLNLFSSMDAIAVQCASMKRHLVRLGAPASHVHFIPYGIDERFFSPLPGVEPEIGFVVSVGETRSRDYAALFSAIEPLPVNLLVVPSGRWYAREKHNRLDGNVPGNVVISRGLSQVELRVLYARAQFAVVPVHDVVYSAGATAVLEAMSMGRAVIVTRSAGILDYVVDGETGIIVDPGDVAMMRDAIHHLAAHPQDARRMGENARQRVVEELNLNEYVQGLAALLTPFL